MKGGRRSILEGACEARRLGIADGCEVLLTIRINQVLNICAVKVVAVEKEILTKEGAERLGPCCSELRCPRRLGDH